MQEQIYESKNAAAVCRSKFMNLKMPSQCAGANL